MIIKILKIFGHIHKLKSYNRLKPLKFMPLQISILIQLTNSFISVIRSSIWHVWWARAGQTVRLQDQRRSDWRKIYQNYCQPYLYPAILSGWFRTSFNGTVDKKLYFAPFLVKSIAHNSWYCFKNSFNKNKCHSFQCGSSIAVHYSFVHVITVITHYVIL